MEDEIKRLIKALVIHQQMDGIIPSYGAYGDRHEIIEDELNREVDNIYSTYKILGECDE